MKKTTKQILLGMAILLAASPLAQAANPRLITRWENFTVANGMPDAKVFSRRR